MERERLRVPFFFSTRTVEAKAVELCLHSVFFFFFWCFFFFFGGGGVTQMALLRENCMSMFKSMMVPNRHAQTPTLYLV